MIAPTLLLVAGVLSLQPAPDADRLRDYHLRLADEPHMAGTPGDARTIERLRTLFAGFGIADVRVHEFWPLLSHPVLAEVAVVAPEQVLLDIRERPLAQDPGSADTSVSTPFNAYSGSGEAIAEVVYANRATREDFEALAAMGVSCKGKIVIARYGGNFRGYKARFAQAAGAAGLIIYTDPADAGYAKGLVYPEGVWANDCCAQRGSIMTLPYQGDPLTPGIEATRDASRLDEKDVALPAIPVQPIGYGAAKEILARMTGRAVPEGWQGGLPFTYRVEGAAPNDPNPLRVRLRVEQKREVMRTANVIATIPGVGEPETLVLVGCHHDAWVYGAADPLCGTIVLLEAARWLADEAAAGRPPRRTVVFAAWGAEEFGIIGSSEWVEANRERLMAHGAAYLNLDMASMGSDFGASASPSLRPVLAQAARRTPHPAGGTTFDAWRSRLKATGEDWRGSFDDLGGGSDHVAFLCHAGVASAGLGAGGSKGTSYHSVYDSLPWYWRAVGSDYAAARLVAGVTIESLRQLAYEPRLPLDPAGYAEDIRDRAPGLLAAARSAGLAGTDEGGALAEAFGSLQRDAADAVTTVRDATPRATTDTLLAADRVWLDEAGLTGRPWFKNRFASPDEDAGYAAWVLPEVQRCLRARDPAGLGRAVDDVRSRLSLLRALFE